MMWVSTTIKRKWVDKILSGEKKAEYKGATDYWKPRLDKIIEAIEEGEPVGINFLCGQEPYKFTVTMLAFHNYKNTIDGVEYDSFYAIHLGERLE